MKQLRVIFAVVALSCIVLLSSIGVAYVHCNHSGTQRFGYVTASSCCCEQHHSYDNAVVAEANCMTQFFAKVSDFSVVSSFECVFIPMQMSIVQVLVADEGSVANHKCLLPLQKIYPPPRLYLSIISTLII